MEELTRWYKTDHGKTKQNLRDSIKSTNVEANKSEGICQAGQTWPFISAPFQGRQRD